MASSGVHVGGEGNMCLKILVCEWGRLQRGVVFERRVCGSSHCVQGAAAGGVQGAAPEGRA